LYRALARSGDGADIGRGVHVLRSLELTAEQRYTVGDPAADGGS
jgi:hypothetical protein